jgi:hypothetical protein
MSLIHCPNCHRLCLTDAASCPSCALAFQPGVLQSRMVAKEKAFSTKVNTLFLSLFLTLLAVLVLVEIQAYVNGVGFFRP